MNETYAEVTLKYVLGMTNEWLRDAEAKNGVLIAVCGAAAAGCITGAGEAASFPALRWVLVAAAVCNLVGVVVGLASFVAILTIPPRTAAPQPANVFFFAHAAAFDTPRAYVTAIRQVLESDAGEPRKVELALAEQILANSRIATLKLAYFRWSILILAAGVILIALAVAVWALRV